MDDNYYCAPKKYLVFHLKMSDHEQKPIVSVERSGKDTGIGASLHRLVHMDVLLTYLQSISKSILMFILASSH